MRYSIAFHVVVGAVTVSAAAVPAPNSKLYPRARYVDLSVFSGFPTMDPQQILDEANLSMKALFDQRIFNDGTIASQENNISDMEEAIEDDVEHFLADEGISSSSTNTNTKTYEVEETTGSSKSSTGSMVCTNDNSQSRLEWSDYADADRTAFVNAIKCLMRKPSAGSQYPGSQNRYEDLVAVHRDMLPNVHQTSSFLPWHRYFVWVFQQMLQEECGFTTPLPWWDETKNAGNFGASDLFSSQWFGELPLKTSSGQGTCVSNGAFANITLHIGPGDSDTNHCLSRGEAREDTKQCNSDYVNSCLSQSAFGDFSTCLELGPHGYGHNGIGAVMSDVASAVGDPIFFMHHSFVDHTFRLWQNANASRLTTISGCADAECTPITLDYVLSSGGLAPNMTVGNALNTLSTSLCYRYDY